jgi:hypothetical protein
VTGKPLRVIARDKRFEDEDLLMGIKSYGPGYGDWTVTRADHWIFEGTGMKNGDSSWASWDGNIMARPASRFPGWLRSRAPV